MEDKLKRFPECLCCHAELFIPSNATSVECKSCHTRMSVIRPVEQGRQQLAESIEQLRRQTHLHTDIIETQIQALQSEFRATKEGQLCELYRQGEDAQSRGNFDEAIHRYQEFLTLCPNEAEAHWRIMLCRYGIEYVREFMSGRALPTITRMDVSGILRDADCLAARNFAPDAQMRNFYIEESRRINNILRDYQEINGTEEPYDVFISVKQADSTDGRPTHDALAATDLYYALDKQGLKVFNSRISLQEYAGYEYEPYIMHALSTAKVLIMVASTEEYMKSPWVRNEWRRFQWLRKNGHPELRLIACILNNGRWYMDELSGQQIVRSATYAAPITEINTALKKVFAEKIQENSAAQENQTVQEVPVFINDVMLETALRQATGKTVLTEKVLSRITELNLTGRGIQSIEGLKYCTGLKALDLSENEFRDIMPLAYTFQLEQLKLNGNRISDIRSLFGLTKLTSLEMNDTGISDVRPLARLVRLNVLSLNHNSISDIQPLSALTNLTELSICGNQFTDVSCLAPLNKLRRLVLAETPSAANVVMTGGTVITALNESGCEIIDSGILFDDIIVPINDAALEQVLRIKLNIPHKPIRVKDLAEITELRAEEKGICNIDALRFCVNLTWLSLKNNQISDIRPLTSLAKLTELYLNQNQISDIHPLSSLINLTILYLWENKISDITPLASLTNLTKLSLGTNQISNIRPLDSLIQLTELYLNQNQISDIRPLTSLAKLTELYLYQNQISDIYPLSSLINLTILSLWENKISDITPLASLTNLTKLDLENNQISDIRPLDSLTKLTYLCLAINQISDIHPLSSLTKLTELYLYQNQISDIYPLSSLKNLTILYLWENKISDITPLASLTNLTKLDLGINQISNITPLDSLTKLTFLGLVANQISDIHPLSSLINLTILYSWGNKISDITSLASLANLTELSLSQNQISDITPLASLSQLTKLYLSQNPISNTSPLTSLRSRGCKIDI